MKRTLLLTVAFLTVCSSANAGLRDECLELAGIAVDDIGILKCTAAIRENERDGALYVTRGDFYSLWRDYDRAAADYIKAKELGVTGEKLDGMLGNAYLQKGDHDRAIALFDTIIQRNPKNIYASTKRGEAYRRKGDLKRALADLNNSIDHLSAEIATRLKADPQDHFLLFIFMEENPYYYRGLVFSSMKDYSRAIEDFTVSISRGQNPPWAVAVVLSHRADAYLKMGSLEQALADADKAVETDASTADHFELRARVREAMAQKGEALKDLRRAISIDPKHKNSLESLKRLGSMP